MSAVVKELEEYPNLIGSQLDSKRNEVRRQHSKCSMRAFSLTSAAFLTSALSLLTALFSFFGSHPAYALILTICTLPIAAILLAVSYAEQPYSWGQPKVVLSRRASRSVWMVIGVSVALTLSVLTTHWPLRVSYYLSKASLNRIAVQVRADAKEFPPQSVGVFTITQANIDADLVYLRLDDDTGEPSGFVQGPSSEVKAKFSDYDVIVLDGDWCLVNSL